MNLKNLTLEISAVLACYLIMSLPIAGATTVNIRLNGQLMDSVEYKPSNIVNLDVGYVRDPNDISWSNVRVAITLTSASMAHTISKVYLYKCGTLSPNSCLQKTPEVFDSYVDTEIAWSDISGSTGQQTYPQEGSLLFLVKLDNPDGVSSWLGMWSKIKRPSYREFIFDEQELGDMDVHASASQFVAPIAAYIENFNSIPFSWLTRAAFDSADSITAIGGDDADLDSSPPVLQSVQPSGKDITVINKENYFIFPQISGSFGNPITLEQNPGFECGDGHCKSSLGENSDICCYDCGCESGFCDSVPGSPETGVCRSHDNIGLDVVGIPSAEVTDCSRSFEVAITARVNNPPHSMSPEVTGSVNVAGETYPAECTESSGLYSCRFTMLPGVRCGSGTTQIGPNELTLTIEYLDGANQVPKDISETFSAISVNYDCGCQGDSYCDSGTDTCESEDAITLGITELTSYLDNYNPGDTIRLKAKIFNPPTGTVLVSSSANLSLTNGVVSPGTPTCTGPSEDFEYECTIPFSITGYQDSVNYKFYPNYLDFQITYNDGDVAKTKNLVTGFGPLSIPSQNCGNGVANQDETYANCCQDVGCEFPNEYCDVSRGCSSLDDIKLSVIPYPVEFEDCQLPHEVSLRTTIENAPYGVRMDYKSVTINDQPVPWQLECPSSSIGGIFDCLLEIPPLQGCELPYYEVGPNKMQMSISFPEGDGEGAPRTLDLNAIFSNLYVIPVPHIDGTCEPSLGENGATACVDCPCADDVNFGEDYYCDHDSYLNPGGTCRLKSDMELVVETPTSPVWFSSCEKHNSYAVLMHVRNQPSTMEVENVFATVGGEAARYVNCKESKGSYLESNLTLNCSITIPSISTCSMGETYNYSENSVSLVISFEDGERGTVLKTLTAETPEVFITQEIMSLHDIVNEAEVQMDAVLDNIMLLTEKTADILYDCIEMQMIAMFISAMMTLVMGFVGAYGGGEPAAGGGSEWVHHTTGTQPYSQVAPTSSGFDMQGFSQGMQAGQMMGSGFVQIISKMCDNLQKVNEIEIHLQEMQIERLKMETCLAVNQHTLDSGMCRGQEESCFDNMLSCLDFSEINNIRERVGDDMNQINENFNDMNDGLLEVVEGFEEFGDYTSTNQYLWVGVSGSYYYGESVKPFSTFISNGAVICRYSARTDYWTTSSCYSTKISIKSNPPKSCKYSYFSLTDAQGQLKSHLGSLDNPGSSVQSYEFTLDAGMPEGDYYVNLHCARNTDFDFSRDYVKERVMFRIAKSYPNTHDDESKRCQCEYNGEVFAGIQTAGTGSIMSTSAPTSSCGISPGKEYVVIDDLVTYKEYEGNRFTPLTEEGSCTIPKMTSQILPNSKVKTVDSKSVGEKEYWRVIVVKNPDSKNEKYCKENNDLHWVLACSGGEPKILREASDEDADTSEKTTSVESEVVVPDTSDDSQDVSLCAFKQEKAYLVDSDIDLYGLDTATGSNNFIRQSGCELKKGTSFATDAAKARYDGQNVYWRIQEKPSGCTTSFGSLWARVSTNSGQSCKVKRYDGNLISDSDFLPPTQCTGLKSTGYIESKKELNFYLLEAANRKAEKIPECTINDGGTLFQDSNYVSNIWGDEYIIAIVSSNDMSNYAGCVSKINELIPKPYFYNSMLENNGNSIEGIVQVSDGGGCDVIQPEGGLTPELDVVSVDIQEDSFHPGEDINVVATLSAIGGDVEDEILIELWRDMGPSSDTYVDQCIHVYVIHEDDTDDIECKLNSVDASPPEGLVGYYVKIKVNDEYVYEMGSGYPPRLEVTIPQLNLLDAVFLETSANPGEKFTARGVFNANDGDVSEKAVSIEIWRDLNFQTDTLYDSCQFSVTIDEGQNGIYNCNLPVESEPSDSLEGYYLKVKVDGEEVYEMENDYPPRLGVTTS